MNATAAKTQLWHPQNVRVAKIRCVPRLCVPPAANAIPGGASIASCGEIADPPSAALAMRAGLVCIDANPDGD